MLSPPQAGTTERQARFEALHAANHAVLASSYVPREFDGEAAMIAAALRRLPRQQRELLALNAWEGLDYGEIATVLGCSRNAVRIRAAARAARRHGRSVPYR